MPFNSVNQCGPGNQTRNYTVAVAAAAGGANCSAEDGALEVQACNMTIPCNATCSCGKPHSFMGNSKLEAWPKQAGCRKQSCADCIGLLSPGTVSLY